MRGSIPFYVAELSSALTRPDYGQRINGFYRYFKNVILSFLSQPSPLNGSRPLIYYDKSYSLALKAQYAHVFWTYMEIELALLIKPESLFSSSRQGEVRLDFI